MRCHICNVLVADGDSYCRRCGASLHVIDVPAVRHEARSLTMWEEARPAVSQGIALLAAGAVLRWALSRAGRAAISRTLGADLGDGAFDARSMLPALRGRAVKDGADDIEIFWYRRLRH